MKPGEAIELKPGEAFTWERATWPDEQIGLGVSRCPQGSEGQIPCPAIPVIYRVDPAWQGKTFTDVFRKAWTR